MWFLADRVVRTTYRLPSPLFSTVVLSVIKITHWGWGGENKHCSTTARWLLYALFMNVAKCSVHSAVSECWGHYSSSPGDASLETQAEKWRSISASIPLKIPLKLKCGAGRKCWNWFRLIISLNYRCLSASIPSLLQSWLGCPTLLDTHTHTRAQVCSVRRSACVSEQENKAYLRFDYFHLRHVWNLPFFFCCFTVAVCWSALWQ